MTTLYSFISRRYCFVIGFFLLGAFLLSGCTSTRTALFTRIPTSNTRQLSARFSATLPQDNQKVKGLIKLTHTTDLQLSFRAPVVGNEVIRIVLTKDSILMIDRIHKCYVKTTSYLFAKQFDPNHASEYSLQKTEKKMWKLSKKQTAVVRASTLGCPIMNETEVMLYKISTEPFTWRTTTISSRYKQLTLDEYLKIED